MNSTEINDDHDYKASVRREWTAAAAGWQKWLPTLEAEAAGPAVTRVRAASLSNVSFVEADIEALELAPPASTWC